VPGVVAMTPPMATKTVGPRDMTVLLGLPSSGPRRACTLMASTAGRAALMQAYDCMGISSDMSLALLASAQAPPPDPKPLWDSTKTVDVAALFASKVGSSTGKSAGEDDAIATGIHAALLKAAATNSDPQNTMALIAAATAAHEAATAEPPPPPPPPPGEVGPLPPGSERVAPSAVVNGEPPGPPLVGEEDAEAAQAGLQGAALAFGMDRPSAAGPVSFSITKAQQAPLTLSSEAEGSSEQQSQKVSGMETLWALMEANKEKSDAVVRGYARVSTTGKNTEGGKGVFEAAEGSTLDFNGVETEGYTKVFFGGIPRGTSEGLILVESKKFGTVISVYYEADSGNLLEGGWAVVTFATEDEAVAAVRRLQQRVALFGAAQPVEVRLGTPEDDERVEQSRQGLLQKPDSSTGADGTGADDAGVQKSPSRNDAKGADKKKKRKRSRSRRRRRDRRRRRRSSSYSDSSSSSEAEEKPAPRPVPTEQRKVRGSNFDAVPSAGANAAGAPGLTLATMGVTAVPAPGGVEVPSGGRQVGVRGSWAEFATSAGRTYYVNVVTGEKTWARPVDYSNQSSNRAGGQVSANGIPLHHSNLFVGSIPLGCTEIMFRQMFQPFGHIVSMKVVPEKRHGFVKFGSVPEAQNAIDTMNGVVINGTPLSVKYASMGCH